MLPTCNFYTELNNLSWPGTIALSLWCLSTDWKSQVCSTPWSPVDCRETYKLTSDMLNPLGCQRAPQIGKTQLSMQRASTIPTVTMAQFIFLEVTGKAVGMMHSTCAHTHHTYHIMLLKRLAITLAAQFKVHSWLNHMP